LDLEATYLLQQSLAQVLLDATSNQDIVPTLLPTVLDIDVLIQHHMLQGDLVQDVDGELPTTAVNFVVLGTFWTQDAPNEPDVLDELLANTFAAQASYKMAFKNLLRAEPNASLKHVIDVLVAPATVLTFEDASARSSQVSGTTDDDDDDGSNDKLLSSLDIVLICMSACILLALMVIVLQNHRNARRESERVHVATHPSALQKQRRNNNNNDDDAETTTTATTKPTGTSKPPIIMKTSSPDTLFTPTMPKDPPTLKRSISLPVPAAMFSQLMSPQQSSLLNDKNCSPSVTERSTSEEEEEEEKGLTFENEEEKNGTTLEAFFNNVFEEEKQQQMNISNQEDRDSVTSVVMDGDEDDVFGVDVERASLATSKSYAEASVYEDAQSRASDGGDWTNNIRVLPSEDSSASGDSASKPGRYCCSNGLCNIEGVENCV
jgi:type II secretory pathway pseudopilin PulG